MKPILCLTGPTAVGKSNLALQIAKRLNCRIISADSMQIYKGLDVGTAKPSKEEQSEVKHELIDILAPDQSYNSFLYKQDATGIVSRLGCETPFVVGGTAFYMDSLLYSLDFTYNRESEIIRERLWKLYEQKGADELHKMLEEKDSDSAEKIHKNNVKRVIRALEIAESGQKMSDGKGVNRQKDYDYMLFALNASREKLYERIDKRVDLMIYNGLIDEVKDIYEKYPNKSLQSLQAIGYKETIMYLEGEISLSDCVELIKKNSRNYAKRQITYLKRMNPEWIDAEKGEDFLSDYIIEKYQKYSQKY